MKLKKLMSAIPWYQGDSQTNWKTAEAVQTAEAVKTAEVVKTAQTVTTAETAEAEAAEAAAEGSLTLLRGKPTPKPSACN
jgi:hypothetical protein